LLHVSKDIGLFLIKSEGPVENVTIIARGRDWNHGLNIPTSVPGSDMATENPDLHASSQLSVIQEIDEREEENDSTKEDDFMEVDESRHESMDLIEED
jgi:hypothetical protein